MAIYKAGDTIGKLYKGSNQIGKVYKGGTLVYTAESEPVTLESSVNQSGEYNNLNWNHAEYNITEDWDTLTVISSVWGKSFGKFETALYLIEGSTQTELIKQSGAYNGYPDSVKESELVAVGTTYKVKKGQKVRLSVGASYDSNVSTPLITTSSITFKFT